ncbi:major facilitator superfamily domain-containing protein [Coniella lustricola]|uniref:Major facilitator superfamily domain-containing protein n=1 Tax=Coniella lustricola TaxID=2025994 RepID=A0A2T2ZST9_9PEZI|nr:major facilitator superfamily domain-containing protein [Coniella lustricola]
MVHTRRSRVWPRVYSDEHLSATPPKVEPASGSSRGGIEFPRQQDAHHFGASHPAEKSFFKNHTTASSSVAALSLGLDELQPSSASFAKADERYHVFDAKKKWFVVVMIGAAGLFSGLSSNIYFPSLDAIATVCSLPIAPVIWGSFSDALGRRPIYIASFTVYIISNIALSITPNFAVLMVFRGLQAAGSASTVSIGNGVIQDIATPSERGGFISFYQAIRNFSIAIGPVLGGLLSNFFGFRSIFVFLVILSSITIVMIITFLPETMRSITGNGAIRVRGIYKPLYYYIKGEPPYMEESDEPILRKPVQLKTFTDPLKLLGQTDILLNLIFGGVVYAIWSMVTSSTTLLFKGPFHLSELTLGLVFLPNGLGTIIGSTVVGNLMTKNYKRLEQEYIIAHDLPKDYKLPAKNIPVDFPIEEARLSNLWWITALFITSTALYGFTLNNTTLLAVPGWIGVPLMLQFLIAATSNAVFAVNQTIITDLCPGKGASATAINNLVRCSLGAVGVAFVDTLITTYGSAVAFFALAMIMILICPLAMVNWFWGPGWRQQRQRQNDKAEGKASKSAMV